MADEISFVWVKGLRGPQPEIWMNFPQTIDQKPVVPLQRHILTDEDLAVLKADMLNGLETLAKKYLFDPAKAEEVPAAIPTTPKPPFSDAAS